MAEEKKLEDLELKLAEAQKSIEALSSKNRELLDEKRATKSGAERQLLEAQDRIAELACETVDSDMCGIMLVHRGRRVATAPVMRALGQQLGVQTPIADAVCRVIAGEVSVQGALQALLQRESRPEPDRHSSNAA